MSCETLEAKTIVNRTKSHFSRHGIPSVVHTENGPCFKAKEYTEFAQQYGFEHSTSSPEHSQGNGKAESAVKIAKSILKKCEDKELGLLMHINTPQRNNEYTPAQRD